MPSFMGEKKLRLLFYSLSDPHGLAYSYQNAAIALGHHCMYYDYELAHRKHVPFGKWGFKLHQRLYFENLHYKASRDFVIYVKDQKPDAIFFFTNAPVTSGALIFIKSILPKVKLVLVWPDSLLNFTPPTIANLPLFDYVASYSFTALPLFQNMTTAKVEFVPLAADESIHQIAPANNYTRLFGFVGGWRPEREKYIKEIALHFGSDHLVIHGPYWKEKCVSHGLKKCIHSSGIRGKDLAVFFNSTLLNLNIIDDTNYPSANMRFFEIPVAGGLQLSTPCPEMENDFKDLESVIYFYNASELIDRSEKVISGIINGYEIKMNAHRKVIVNHTYQIRMAQIINSII